MSKFRRRRASGRGPSRRSWRHASLPSSKVSHAQSAGPRRFKPAVAWFIVAALFLWRPLELAEGVPPLVWKVAGVAGLTVVAYALLTFRRWNDETPHLWTFFCVFAVAILELLVENFFNWVAAASDERKYDNADPLQDNVAILGRRLAERSTIFNAVVSWHWAHIANMLLIWLAIPFSVLWSQVPYSGFAMASRALAMHAIVRVVRTVCFCAVILPNSRDGGCYSKRFPPPPDTWREFVLVGLGTLKGMGGCNDLIISGHAVAWMLPVVTITTYYPYGALKYLVWAAYIQTALRTTVEGWHYSVDFVLPAALCWYVWKDLDWLCPVAKPLAVRSRFAKDPLNGVALALVSVGLICIFILAFMVGS